MMFIERFNAAPFWVRGPIFLLLCAIPLGCWIANKGMDFYKIIAAKQEEIQTMQKRASSLHQAMGARGLEIFSHHLAAKEDFANILAEILPEFSKKTLNSLSTGTKKNLMPYLELQLGTSKNGKASSKAPSAQAPSAPTLTGPLLTLVNEGGIPNPKLLAEETQFELTDSFKNLYRLLKKAEKHENIFWREININVKEAPQSLVAIKVFTISKEESHA